MTVPSQDLYKAFFERTKANLEKNDAEFEVTDLINSLLGLLVIPSESFFSEVFEDESVQGLASELIVDSFDYADISKT